MKNILYTLVTALLTTGLLMSSVAFADGKSGKYKFKQLSPEMQKAVSSQLRKLKLGDGGEINMGQVTTQITTSDCPSNCNDKVAGGMCLCDATDGKCPDGDPPSTDGGKECSVKPTTANVVGGGINRPAQIQTSSGF